MSNRVAVVIPVFNIEPALLRRAVLSAVSQSHESLAVVVVDDGSHATFASATAEVLRSIDSRHSISLESLSRNSGISRARNVGARRSSSEWLLWLDGDDTLDEHCISHLVAASTNRDLVIGECNVWERGSMQRRRPSLCFADASSRFRTVQDPFARNVSSLQPQLFRRAAFERLGGFNEHYKFAEVTELFLRYLTLFGLDRLAFCENATYNYHRDRGDSVSSARVELTEHRERCLTAYLQANRIPGSRVRYVARNSESGIQEFEILP